MFLIHFVTILLCATNLSSQSITQNRSFDSCEFCSQAKQLLSSHDIIQNFRSEFEVKCDVLALDLKDACYHFISSSISSIDTFILSIQESRICEYDCDNYTTTVLFASENICERIHQISKYLEVSANETLIKLRRANGIHPKAMLLMNREQFLESVLRNIIAKSVQLIQMNNVCHEVPDSKRRLPFMAPNYSLLSNQQLICGLCDTLVDFTSQILNPEIPVGLEVAKKVAENISRTCQKVMHYDVLF